MQISKPIAAAFIATGWSPALASSTDAGVAYRPTRTAPNPHEVFRRNIEVDNALTKTALAMKGRDCPMMKRVAVSKSSHGG